MKDRLRRIRALIRHKIAFFRIERSTFRRRTFRSVTHDLDKLIMYLLPLSTNFVRRYHKRHARHHNPRSMKDYYERLVDMECARYTKRNSRLTALEFINTLEESEEVLILKILAKEYNLK